MKATRKRLVHHPLERNAAKSAFTLEGTADVRMHAGEPGFNQFGLPVVLIQGHQVLRKGPSPLIDGDGVAYVLNPWQLSRERIPWAPSQEPQGFYRIEQPEKLYWQRVAPVAILHD